MWLKLIRFIDSLFDIRLLSDEAYSHCGYGKERKSGRNEREWEKKIKKKKRLPHPYPGPKFKSFTLTLTTSPSSAPPTRHLLWPFGLQHRRIFLPHPALLCNIESLRHLFVKTGLEGRFNYKQQLTSGRCWALYNVKEGLWASKAGYRTLPRVARHQLVIAINSSSYISKIVRETPSPL